MKTINDKDPNFLPTMSSIASGEMSFLGERWELDGSRTVAIGPITSRNSDEPRRGQVRIGREYYTTALKDYDDWKEKWWREVIQNAVDAGATNIACEAISLPDGTWNISCSDNGKGMDESTILDKFLVLGGTSKVGEGGATGGFGKAKELIILPWIQWTVRSRTSEIVGAGIEYEVRKAPAVDGTKVSVIMPSDNYTHDAAAISFISKCYLPKIKFTVNGKTIKANLKPKENVHIINGKAEIYHNKNDRLSSPQALVRSNGIYHFGIYVSSDVPGTFLIELTGKTIDMLTANRDGFRDANLRYSIQNFISKLATEVMTMLTRSRGGIRKKYKGSGGFKSTEAELRRDLLGDIAVSIEPNKRLSDDDIEKFVGALEKTNTIADYSEVSGQAFEEVSVEVETIETRLPRVTTPVDVIFAPPSEYKEALSESEGSTTHVIESDGVANPDLISIIAGSVTAPRTSPPPAASPTTDGDLDGIAEESASIGDSVGAIAEADIAKTPEIADSKQEQFFDLRSLPDIARIQLDVGIKGSTHIEAAVKQLAWEPDFFIINEVIDEYGTAVSGGEVYRVPKMFMPETMAPNVRKLARLWAELCRFVLIQLGSQASFGVGFIFSERTMACCLTHEGEPWLLLNPFKNGIMKRPRGSEDSGQLYSAHDVEDLAMLYALAIHETTHLADGISYHNQAFASALTRNIARTYGRDKQVKAIRKAVAARGFLPGKL